MAQLTSGIDGAALPPLALGALQKEAKLAIASLRAEAIGSRSALLRYADANKKYLAAIAALIELDDVLEIKPIAENKKTCSKESLIEKRLSLIEGVIPKAGTVADARELLYWILALIKHFSCSTQEYRYNLSAVLGDEEHRFISGGIALAVKEESSSWRRYVVRYLLNNVWAKKHGAGEAELKSFVSKIVGQWRCSVGACSVSMGVVRDFEASLVHGIKVQR